jgi:hypothetical protein
MKKLLLIALLFGIDKLHAQINITPSTATICAGQTTTFTASGANSYTWSPTQGLSATSGVIVTANPRTSTTYTVKGSSGKSATVTITVNASPTITTQTTDNCRTTTLTATGDPTNNYTWTPSEGLNASNGSMVVARPTITTIYTVTLANGCTYTEPVSIIHIRNKLTENGEATLIATGGTNNNYTWTPSEGLNKSTGNNVVASPTITTIYTVTLANGCTDTVKVNDFITVLVLEEKNKKAVERKKNKSQKAIASFEKWLGKHKRKEKIKDKHTLFHFRYNHQIKKLLRKMKKDTASSPMQFPSCYKKNGYCGYIVQYDPYCNCTKIYHYKNGKYKKVKQVPVGTSAQFYVNNLNFLKYNLNATSSNIDIPQGDPGMIGALATALQGTISKILPTTNMLTKGFINSNTVITCPYKPSFQSAENSLDSFLMKEMESLLKDFSDAYKDMLNSNDGKSDANIGEKLREYLNTYSQKNGLNGKDYRAFALNPAGFIKGQKEAHFTAFNNKVNEIKSKLQVSDTTKLKSDTPKPAANQAAPQKKPGAPDKQTNPKPDSSKSATKDTLCSSLLLEIDRETLKYAALDSGYTQLVSALAKVYPLPDWEYQYNVPQVKNVDYLDFTINLKGNDVTRNVRLNMKDEEIYVPVWGGIRIDFSTGLMFNNFNSPSYSIKDSLTYKHDTIMNKGNKIIQEKDNKMHFGVATMLHVYTRCWRNFSLSPVIGLGLTTDLNYSFLGGASLILGRTQRASISLGYSLNSYKELSLANSVGEYVPTDYTLKTVTRFHGGFFISVGYNISLSSKSSNVQTASTSDTSDTSGSGSAQTGSSASTGAATSGSGTTGGGKGSGSGKGSK